MSDISVDIGHSFPPDKKNVLDSGCRIYSKLKYLDGFVNMTELTILIVVGQQDIWMMR